MLVYEGRFRDPDRYSERWLTHQRGKIMRALAAFETACPTATKTDIVTIGLACALGYLDWRKTCGMAAKPSESRGLALRHFSKNEPAFERSRAPEP